MFMIVFCLIYILQIQNISTGFRDMSNSVNFRFANMSSDSPTTAIERCTDIKQSYCFIKVHWSIKNFVKLKETQLFYLVIKLTKALVSAWQNFD